MDYMYIVKLAGKVTALGEIMMACRIFILIFILSNYSYANEWQESAVVVAKAHVIKKINDVDTGQLFEVRLKEIEVVHGKFNHKKFTVKLVAHQEKSIDGKEIFALLKKNDKNYDLVDWGFIQKIVCVDNEILENQNLKKSFYFEDKKTNRSCINAEWFNSQTGKMQYSQ